MKIVFLCREYGVRVKRAKIRKNKRYPQCKIRALGNGKDLDNEREKSMVIKKRGFNEAKGSLKKAIALSKASHSSIPSRVIFIRSDGRRFSLTIIVVNRFKCFV